MNSRQTSYDEPTGDRADNEDSGSETEVFFNKRGSSRQTESQEMTQHDTLVNTSQGQSLTSENEQTVAAASLMQLREVSQTQTRGSSIPNSVSHLHQGSITSSHSYPSMQKIGRAHV